MQARNDRGTGALVHQGRGRSGSDTATHGGEYAVNNADPNVTGTFARNHFGRDMGQKGSGDTSYFAMMIGSSQLNTFDGTPDENTWEDTGHVVPRRKN